MSSIGVVGIMGKGALGRDSLPRRDAREWLKSAPAAPDATLEDPCRRMFVGCTLVLFLTTLIRPVAGNGSLHASQRQHIDMLWSMLASPAAAQLFAYIGYHLLFYHST